jgi:hypothetical protein
MATTIDQVQKLLRELGWDCRKEERYVSLGFKSKNFRQPDGTQGIFVVVELSEDGEYVKIFSPGAFRIDGEHVDPFLRACSMIQWRTKLIQFEFDENDKEVRPIVEFPIEDAPLTARQLGRCVNGLCTLLDQYYDTLKKALETGEISFPEAAPPPPEVMLRLALEAFRKQGIPETDERIVAIRRMLGESASGPASGAAPGAL